MNDNNFDPGGSQTHTSRPSAQKGVRGQNQFRSRSNSRGSISSDTQSKINNVFNTLPDDVDEHEVIRTSHSNVPDSPNHSKPPPITVFGVAIDTLSALVLKKLGKSENVSYKLTQFGTKIFVNNVRDYKTLRDFLLKSKVNCFTHTLRNEQSKKFVLKGLHELNVALINDALLSYGIVPTDIKRMNLNQKRYDDQTLCLLYFKHEDRMTLEKLRMVKHIENVIVKFEHYSKKKSGPILCANVFIMVTAKHLVT